MSSSEIELNNVSSLPTGRHDDHHHDQERTSSDEQPHTEFSLPSVDTGKDAWSFLAAAFVLEGLTWGFPFSFGVFQDYYSTHAPFEGSRNIAVIGTCAMGIMYIDLPIIFAIMLRWPRTRGYFTGTGLILMCLALSLSSFSTTTTHLMATQGVIYAIGGSMGYAPCIMYMDEWFVRRKGLAFGIMWAGTGLAGVILPILMQHLLNTYGYQTTLRVWAISLFVLTGPLLYFIKPRVPLSQATASRRLDFSFLKTRIFNTHQICNIIEAIGFFLPSIYLPTYARSLGGSPVMSALPVVLFNGASVLGNILMGSIVDRFHVTTCLMISAIGATTSVFCIWGVSTSLAPLFVFAVIYGLSAGSFTCCWSGVMRDIALRERAEPGLVYACLAAGRGIGSVVAGPLSEMLIRGEAWKGAGKLAYGTGFGPLIVFTGVTAVFSGASVLGRRVGWV